MKKKTEYKEPEFKVVIFGSDDIITTSGEIGNLGRVTDDWEDDMFSI